MGGDASTEQHVSGGDVEQGGEWWADAEERRDEAVLALVAQAAAYQSPLRAVPAHDVLPPGADIITRVRTQYELLYGFVTAQLAVRTS